MSVREWTWEEEQAIRKRREEMRKKTLEEAESILKLAGFTINHTFELVNGYWPDSPQYDEVRKPWWLFLTDVGPIQLGWRKNVMHIDWSASNLHVVVTEDEVTKTERYVHAWKVEKAVEYLKVLHAFGLKVVAQ